MKWFLEIKKSIIIIVFGILIIKTGISCSENEYEKAVKGNYKVFEYEPMDSMDKSDIPLLSLFSNKEFVLKFKETKITGKWDAFDNGDHTYIKFHFGSYDSDATVEGKSLNIIHIYNPVHFECPKLNNFSFIRIEK